ncbi:hypothetical protein [Planctomycetes bacterium TBK1r]|uniref:Uncharacterized protein n=1 Tax=Stieleria magnilauensis TaxID=2527963 RepID=A0ABX5XH78_9BACT|nr:hypothetical protein TBK1r_02600 [Planctomycetes bacterium TBK1r]
MVDVGKTIVKIAIKSTKYQATLTKVEKRLWLVFGSALYVIAATADIYLTSKFVPVPLLSVLRFTLLLPIDWFVTFAKEG